MDSVRIDKWLWAARFFKTRALASRACDLGRVLWNEHPAKPARDIRPGDRLRITNEGGIFDVEVLALAAARGSAAIAQTLYRETVTSREAREKLAAERKALFAAEGPSPARRPTKQERRRIHSFSGRW